MTSVEELALDELILQTFEEQEDQFYYPIRSQNTARSFIKALNTKGLSYEALCGEIDEFEHNFSAWRKGLGRVGIGRRVIERLNRPIQEVLLSDDEEEINDILARIKDRETTRPDNNRVPPLPEPAVVHTEETRILRLRHNEDRPREVSPGSGTSTPSRHSPAPNAEIQQTEPGLADFRSVLKRRSHVPDEAKVAAAENRRSLPNPSQLTSPKSNKSHDKPQTDNHDKKTKLVKPELSLSLKNKTSPSKKEALDTSNEFDGEKEFDSLGNSFENESSSQKTTLEKPTNKAAPLADEEMDESLSSIDSSEEVSLSSEEEEESSDSAPEINEPLPETAAVTTTTEVAKTESEDKTPEIHAGQQDYDSDLDPENPDLVRDGKRLADQIAAYKSRMGSRDGPGYLYVFRDSGSQLMKIGQSRRPQRRLEQALCFNTALEQLSALPVSLKVLAVQRAHARLSRFQVKGHPGWFSGPTDEIIRVVTSTAERYPHNSSQC